MSEPYVTFEVPCAAEGKRAHNSRVIFKNGKPIVIHYPDALQVKHEEFIADYARLAMLGLPRLAETAVSVAIEAVFQPPASWSEKKAAAALAGEVAHIAKPDWDNISKSVCDAMKGICWDDDSRVVMGQVQKSYGPEAYIRVTVWKWFEDVEPEPAQLGLIGDFGV